MSFPKNFLWGTSISAAQCEGGWDEDGKSPVQVDFGNAGSTTERRKIFYQKADGTRGSIAQFGLLPEGGKYVLFDDVHYPNHVACDFYHHWKEDLALFAEMGFTTFNTSISWARIYPHGVEGGVNQKGVEFYRNVFTEARRLGMDPVITLYKYDEPVYFEEKYGGWTNRAMIDEFVEFAKTCFKEYKGLVNKWMTFNEINIMLMYLSRGIDLNKSKQMIYEEIHNQMVAAARSVQAAHEIDPDLKVGCMICSIDSYPLTPDPKDVMANYEHWQDICGYCADTMMRGYYPSYAVRMWKQDGVDLNVSEEDKKDLLNGKSDFMGFSYYSSSCITTHVGAAETSGNGIGGVKNPYLKASEWGWLIDPVGFKYTLHFYNDRYQKPLFDVENGLGAFDKVSEDGKVHDPYRIDYLRKHIKAMKEAVEEGVDLRGYTTWGGLDLVSAGTGQMDKRYGMIYVDMDDQGNGDLHRIRKDSFYWYEKCIKSNGEDLD